MYGPAKLFTIGYVFWLGYVAHKYQVPQKAIGIIRNAMQEVQRDNARAFLDELRKQDNVKDLPRAAS